VLQEHEQASIAAERDGHVTKSIEKEKLQELLSKYD